MKLKKGKSLDKIAKKHVVKKKKKNLAEVTTDDFFNQSFEMDLTDDDDEQLKKSSKVTKKKTKSVKATENGIDTSNDDANNHKPSGIMKIKKNGVSKDSGKDHNSVHKKGLKSSKSIKKKSKKSEGDNDSLSGDSDLDPVQHKKSLMNLKETDPEFFDYLKQHDTKLLDFNVSDEEADNDPDDEDDLKHIPDDNLEVASDESDYEPENSEKTVSKSGIVKVNLKLLNSWQEELEKDKSAKTIKCIVEAFHAALENITDSETHSTKYRVDGPAIFNGIIQLCILHLPNAFKKFLNLGDETRFEAHKAKRFQKVKGVLKSYLSDLIQVLENVSSPDVISTLLKHLHQMLPYTQSFSSLRKPLLRILLKYWSTATDESVPVVSFLCIVKIATTNSVILNGLLKTMYIKYVENSKFVSPTTLPAINFMRRSLTEIYLLDSNLSYHNAFLYVRQLAIHLRNALTLKKKEHFQAVYNWQYLNSLWFWSELIPSAKKDSLLRQLVYPLVQITIGVIKLIPTWQYYPLRFHCIKMLINISREAGVFIPLLPLITDILDTYDFNKRHKSVSMKPISLMCLLRVSKSQAQENGYKDAVIENIYELLLESAANASHTVYFPDLFVPCVIQLKNFLKKCHVANYCRKIKQLLEKIEESRKFIECEREKESFELKEMKKIEAWEAKIKSKGTPMNKFYDSWVKVHQSMQMKMLTKNDEVADFKLPTIKKTKRGNKQRDSDEDSDLEIPVEEMERRLKKDKKQKKKFKKSNEADDVQLPTDDTDVVQDMKPSDWD